jgi:hypothetical protein
LRGASSETEIRHIAIELLAEGSTVEEVVEDPSRLRMQSLRRRASSTRPALRPAADRRFVATISAVVLTSRRYEIAALDRAGRP